MMCCNVVAQNESKIAIDSLQNQIVEINTNLAMVGTDLKRYDRQYTIGCVLSMGGTIITYMGFYANKVSPSNGLGIVGLAMAGIGYLMTASSSAHIGRAGRKLRKENFKIMKRKIPKR